MISSGFAPRTKPPPRFREGGFVLLISLITKLSSLSAVGEETPQPRGRKTLLRRYRISNNIKYSDVIFDDKKIFSSPPVGEVFISPNLGDDKGLQVK